REVDEQNDRDQDRQEPGERHLPLRYPSETGCGDNRPGPYSHEKGGPCRLARSAAGDRAVQCRVLCTRSAARRSWSAISVRRPRTDDRIRSRTRRKPSSSSLVASGRAQSRSSSDFRWAGQLASSRHPIVTRTRAWSINSVERGRGGCGGRVSPISASIGPVRGFGAAAGVVPADFAVHPGGGSALKIASAISDLQEFSTQTKSTYLSGIAFTPGASWPGCLPKRPLGRTGPSGSPGPSQGSEASPSRPRTPRA